MSSVYNSPDIDKERNRNQQKPIVKFHWEVICELSYVSRYRKGYVKGSKRFTIEPAYSTVDSQT